MLEQRGYAPDLENSDAVEKEQVEARETELLSQAKDWIEDVFVHPLSEQEIKLFTKIYHLTKVIPQRKSLYEFQPQVQNSENSLDELARFYNTPFQGNDLVTWFSALEAFVNEKLESGSKSEEKKLKTCLQSLHEVFFQGGLPLGIDLPINDLFTQAAKMGRNEITSSYIGPGLSEAVMQRLAIHPEVFNKKEVYSLTNELQNLQTPELLDAIESLKSIGLEAEGQDWIGCTEAVVHILEALHVHAKNKLVGFACNEAKEKLTAALQGETDSRYIVREGDPTQTRSKAELSDRVLREDHQLALRIKPNHLLSPSEHFYAVSADMVGVLDYTGKVKEVGVYIDQNEAKVSNIEMRQLQSLQEALIYLEQPSKQFDLSYFVNVLTYAQEKVLHPQNKSIEDIFPNLAMSEWKQFMEHPHEHTLPLSISHAPRTHVKMFHEYVKAEKRKLEKQTTAVEFKSLQQITTDEKINPFQKSADSRTVLLLRHAHTPYMKQMLVEDLGIDLQQVGFAAQCELVKILANQEHSYYDSLKHALHSLPDKLKQKAVETYLSCAENTQYSEGIIRLLTTTSPDELERLLTAYSEITKASQNAEYYLLSLTPDTESVTADSVKALTRTMQTKANELLKAYTQDSKQKPHIVHSLKTLNAIHVGLCAAYKTLAVLGYEFSAIRGGSVDVVSANDITAPKNEDTKKAMIELFKKTRLADPAYADKAKLVEDLIKDYEHEMDPNNPTEFINIHLGNTLVASIYVHFKNEDTVWIGGLNVAPEAQSQNIVGIIQNKIKQQYYDKYNVLLEVIDDPKAEILKRAYKRQGFQETGNTPEFAHQRFIEMLRPKALHASSETQTKAAA